MIMHTKIKCQSASGTSEVQHWRDMLKALARSGGGKSPVQKTTVLIRAVWPSGPSGLWGVAQFQLLFQLRRVRADSPAQRSRTAAESSTTPRVCVLSHFNRFSAFAFREVWLLVLTAARASQASDWRRDAHVRGPAVQSGGSGHSGCV